MIRKIRVCGKIIESASNEELDCSILCGYQMYCVEEYSSEMYIMFGIQSQTIKEYVLVLNSGQIKIPRNAEL